MWKIKANKINSWFQTTHNKDIYQWRTHKHKSISSWNMKHKKYIYILPLTWISQQSKAKMAWAKKNKIQSEAPRYNLNNSTSSNQQKWNALPNQICTPPFCDWMPKGNQNPSLKGGGGEERQNCAKSARKPRISSRTSTKICPWAA